MPTQSSVNLYAQFNTAGKEISSTYEGRHLEFPESYLTHPPHADGFVNAKDPVRAGYIVGVAFNDGTTTTDVITIDTEGIWALNVSPSGAGGSSAVAVGDQLFINATCAGISKDGGSVNWGGNVLFGVALEASAGSSQQVLAVKVHGDI
jgi:hypothetical protein